ncbi:hypothetical protein RRG08_033265 [Elysia crispata]|uniref:Uncharacterized protein n=1 Tax=Elysia crispata TaxID=231223 RepID=A0AAE0XRI3_9GAST|nr:hypothetical protein RRG08_033265 [Elysia crispata]
MTDNSGQNRTLHTINRFYRETRRDETRREASHRRISEEERIKSYTCTVDFCGNAALHNPRWLFLGQCHSNLETLIVGSASSDLFIFSFLPALMCAYYPEA